MSDFLGYTLPDGREVPIGDLDAPPAVPDQDWRPVVFLADVDEETGFCPVCGDVDYGDCPCPGPTMDGYEYQVVDGVLMARPYGGVSHET